MTIGTGRGKQRRVLSCYNNLKRLCKHIKIKGEKNIVKEKSLSACVRMKHMAIQAHTTKESDWEQFGQDTSERNIGFFNNP